MTPTFARRQRRNRQTSRTDGAFFKKESAESAFFDAPAAAPFFSNAPAAINRKCDKCKDEGNQQPRRKVDSPSVQRKEIPASGPVASVRAVVSTLRSGGQQLPAGLGEHFGSRMGRDFGDTVIHTGTQAAFSAKSINAKAYTLGNHIVFAEGQYQPDTYEGKKLLAHELVHVAQQGQGRAGIYRMTAAGTEPAQEEGALDERPVTLSPGQTQTAASPGGDQPAQEAAPMVQQNSTPDVSAGETSIATSGHGEKQYENKRDFANCAGVHVQGHTDANYSHSFDFSGSATVASGCQNCGASPCIDDTGTIVSTFGANPSVTLPSVPGGLSECETNAVQAFIDGTLSAHEQRHVAAFNTYAGTVTTPYAYHGCQSGEDAFIQGRHNAIEAARRAASNAASAALDPFNPSIPCQCPEPSSTSEVNSAE